MVEKIRETLNISKIETPTPAYIGSDYKFDNDKIRKKKILERGSYCINALPTYRGLEISLRNSDTRLSLESQIVNRERYIKSIDILTNKSIEKSTISLSPGLNVIIGNSGSGKTLLLNQIYYELKNKGLTAAIKDKKVKDGKNPYEKKVGNGSIMNINFDLDISKESIKIVEIPNIYSEILKSQDDEESLVENFGLNNSNSANQIVINYKNDVNKYYEVVNALKNSDDEGDIIYTNISTAIDFLSKNKLQKNTFLLHKEVFNDSELKNILNRKKQIVENIEKKDSIKQYFLSIKELFQEDSSKKKIEDLLKIYNSIIEDLNVELEKIEKQLVFINFDKLLSELINSQIDNSINKLGNREKTVKSRQEIFSNELNKLINNIKNNIILESEEEKLQIIFPYDKLKKEIETNSNTYARLTLDDSEFNIKNTNLEDSKLFNLDKNKTRIKSLNLKKFNLLNSNSSKKLISKLNEININLDLVKSSV